MLDNIKSSHVLIEFEVIVDIDYGILCTIYEKYYDTNIFSKQLLELEPEEWLGLLHDNPTTNPISVLLNPEYEKYSDNYYKQLIDTEIDYIYNKSCLTNMARFIINAISTNKVCITDILCRNKKQYEIMKRLLRKEDSNCYNIILYENKTDLFNANQYSSIFIKYAQSIFNYDGLIEKSIFIAELMCNIDEDLYWRGEGIYPKKLYTALHSESNNISTVRLYDYDNNYFINKNYPYTSDEPIYISEFMDPGNDNPSDDEEDESEEETVPINELLNSSSDDDIDEDEFDPGLGIDIKNLKESDYYYD